MTQAIHLSYYNVGGEFLMYDREKAVQYAHRWAFSRNPKYYDFSFLGGDCTNFASQVLFAGYGEMNYKKTLGWYYNSLNDRSPSWTGVNELYNFLINNRGNGPKAVEVSIDQLQNGDLIQLDFDGDFVFDHTPVIVDTGEYTPDTLLVAAHSQDSDYRPLSTYDYENIRYLHII